MMAVEEVRRGDETASLLQKSKVKFVCSHGGKILPRPSDGILKYVGGETRVISIPRNLNLSELMKKLSNLFEGDFVLRYQMASEDLDALISVKSDDDLRHMLDEYDRMEKEGNAKLRTFLFPAKPTLIESQTPFSALGPHSLEQRFVDAINGIVRSPRSGIRVKSSSLSPIEGSSPQSISPRSMTQPSSINQDNNCLTNSLQPRILQMHKVQSSPSLCSLGGNVNNNTQPSTSYNHRRYCLHNIHHHESPFFQPLMVQADLGKLHVGHNSINHPNLGYCHPLFRGYPGSGGHSKWRHLEEYAAAAYGTASSRPEGLPRSTKNTWE